MCIERMGGSHGNWEMHVRPNVCLHKQTLGRGRRTAQFSLIVSGSAAAFSAALFIGEMKLAGENRETTMRLAFSDFKRSRNIFFVGRFVALQTEAKMDQMSYKVS